MAHLKRARLDKFVFPEGTSAGKQAFVGEVFDAFAEQFGAEEVPPQALASGDGRAAALDGLGDTRAADVDAAPDFDTGKLFQLRACAHAIAPPRRQQY